MPATGFYEPDKINFSKPPFPWHYFQLKDEKLMGFAGLYDVWQDKQTGKEIRSYTIITTTPNEMVGQFHDRMPVILEQELEDGVPGVISRKFSVREIATKSLLVSRHDYIWENNAFCYMLLHTPREM